MKRYRLKRKSKRSKKRIAENGLGAVQSGGVHSDVAYGIFDRPGAEKTTPIVPTEMVATQLVVDRPPIDDPDWAPDTIRTLTAAVAELAKDVPDDQIQRFYKKCQDALENLSAESNLENVGGEEEMTEANLRKKVLAILKETMRDDELKRLQQQFDDEFGPEYEDEEEEAVPATEPTSLKDIAAATGFAGPSGVKNLLYKLQSQMQYFSNVPDDELDAIIEFAMGEYIDLLEQAKLIDASDAAEMLQAKEHVSTLPSFKYFLFHAIMMPTAQKIEKVSRKALAKQLDAIGVPKAAHQTVIHQLVGIVPRSDALIVAKLQSLVKSGKIKPNRARELGNEIANKFAALQKIARGGDDFAEHALQNYAKLNKGKLMNILKKAAKDPDVDAALAT